MKFDVNVPFPEVRKRDGRRVSFDPEKIRKAVEKAGVATEEFDRFESELITGQVLKVLSHRHDKGIPGIENIQLDIMLLLEHRLKISPKTGIIEAGSSGYTHPLFWRQCLRTMSSTADGDQCACQRQRNHKISQLIFQYNSPDFIFWPKDE